MSPSESTRALRPIYPGHAPGPRSRCSAVPSRDCLPGRTCQYTRGRDQSLLTVCGHDRPRLRTYRHDSGGERGKRGRRWRRTIDHASSRAASPVAHDDQPRGRERITYCRDRNLPRLHVAQALFAAKIITDKNLPSTTTIFSGLSAAKLVSIEAPRCFSRARHGFYHFARRDASVDHHAGRSVALDSFVSGDFVERLRRASFCAADSEIRQIGL